MLHAPVNLLSTTVDSTQSTHGMYVVRVCVHVRIEPIKITTVQLSHHKWCFMNPHRVPAQSCSYSSIFVQFLLLLLLLNSPISLYRRFNRQYDHLRMVVFRLFLCYFEFINGMHVQRIYYTRKIVQMPKWTENKRRNNKNERRSSSRRRQQIRTNERNRIYREAKERWKQKNG